MFRTFLLLCLLIAWANLQATACSCIGISTVASELKRTDFVAVGTVKARTRITASTILKGAKHLPNLIPNDTLALLYEYKYTIEVEEVYKGDKQQRIVEIFTGAGGGDCGVQFSVGSKYVIYADVRHTLTAHINGWQIEVPPYFTTDICMRTAEASETEIAELKRIAP
jgi:hypothetical protein